MLAPENIAWGREFAHRREAARRAAWEAEARRTRGVCWSGMGPGPFEPRTQVELEQEALAWAARRQRSLDTSASRPGE